MCHFSNLARRLLLISRPLGSTPRRGGAAVLWSSCSAPSLFSRLGVGAEELLQLAAFEHFHHDVRAANEFPFHIELRDRRPVRIFLNSGANLGVLKDVHRLILRAEAVENGNCPARESALRGERGALHEEYDVVLSDDVGDFGLGVTP